MKPLSALLYGGYGSGKTYLATTSFWDHELGRPREGRKGRILYVGREDNVALDMPDEGKDAVVKRFPFPEDDPLEFVAELEGYLKALVASQKRGGGITDIVLDGWTELCYGFTWAYRKSKGYDDEDGDEGGKKNQFAPYRAWQQSFFSTVHLLHPDVLGANVFGTARVMELRRGVRDKKTGKTAGEDPEWMQDFRYYPSMEGQSRFFLGNYFSLVIYMEEEHKKKLVGGETVLAPIYRSHWLPSGDFKVKNVFAHKWMKARYPGHLDNADWPKVEGMLEAISGQGRGVQAGMDDAGRAGATDVGSGETKGGDRDN